MNSSLHPTINQLDAPDILYGQALLVQKRHRSEETNIFVRVEINLDSSIFIKCLSIHPLNSKRRQTTNMTKIIMTDSIAEEQ